MRQRYSFDIISNLRRSRFGAYLRSSVDYDGSRLILKFEMDEKDSSNEERLDYSMSDVEIYVDLGGDIEASDIHPDLVALATILLCNPFVGKELQLPLSISKGFYEKSQTVISRYRIVSDWSEEIEQIKIPEKGIPGLAFSGGADSSAALAVMPASTIPVFLNRPIEKESMYDSDAPLAICEQLREVGYNVKVVDTNLEYIRDPVGFPTDLANAIPAILLSQHLGLDSIAFGTIMESGYGIGHEHYIEYGEGAHWRFFGTLFDAVGLELSLPVLGVSEVGTAIIGNISPMGYYSQSCIRGTWQNPCMRCWKCFRKELLAYSLGHREDYNLVSMLSSGEVQVRLSAFPISHENVIVYALQRIDLDKHPYLKPIADKLDMSIELNLLGSWFPPSIEFTPMAHRHSIREKILSYLPAMKPSQESILLNWNMEPHLCSMKAKRGQEKLTSFWQDLTTRFG